MDVEETGKEERMQIDVEDRVFVVDLEAYEEERRKEEAKDVVRRALIQLDQEAGRRMSKEVPMVQVGDEWFWIGATGTKSQELSEAASRKEDKEGIKGRIPDEYLSYRSVFTKASFDRLPPHRPWDHAIELIPGA